MYTSFMQTFSTEARNKNCSACGRIIDYEYITDFRTPLDAEKTGVVVRTMRRR